jgi:hypothetical protein
VDNSWRNKGSVLSSTLFKTARKSFFASAASALALSASRIASQGGSYNLPEVGKTVVNKKKPFQPTFWSAKKAFLT